MKNIQLNRRTIIDESMPVSESVDTIIHEGRHAYQYHAIQNPGFEPILRKWNNGLKTSNRGII